MKLCFLIISAITSLNLYATDTVRVKTPSDFHVYGVTNTTFELGSAGPSGDATIETAPAKVYVPISNTNVAFPNHDLYFSKSLSGVTSLFDTSSTSTVANIINFPLSLSLSGTRQYLYGAVYNGTAYQVVKKSAPINSTSSVDAEFVMSTKNICDLFPSACTNLAPGSASLGKGTAKVYFFISTVSNIADNTTFLVTDAGFTGGVFFEVQMSNNILLNTQLKVFITDAKKGDSRVILTYSSDNTMVDFTKIIIFQHSTNSPVPINAPLGSYAGSIINRDFSTNQSGEVTINQLQNSVEVTLSVAFLDKFGFASTLSDDVSITPIEIQELLKKQACYLLTAGFGEEHYVITFFRHYRSQILSNTWLGRKFIKAYYRSAPHYAVIIYQSEWMRFVIRSLAYGLYFLFNYSWLLLIFLGSCLYLDKRKIKITLS